MMDRPLSDRQVEVLAYLRRTADPFTPAWLVAKALGVGIQAAAANLRELRRRGLVVRRLDGGEWQRSLKGAQHG